MKIFTGAYPSSALAIIAGVLSSLFLSPIAKAASYTWVGTGANTNWTTADNWEPTRIPAADDILIFDGSRTATATVYVDFASPQAIGQLRFINNIVAVLTVKPNTDPTAPPPARQLNIAAGLLGADFEITTGSSVQVKSPDGVKSTAGLTFQLGLDETAAVAGTLIFGSNSPASNTNDPHRLLSLRKNLNAIQFNAGGLFRADQQFAGDAFGTTTAYNNTVVFKSGSTYDHRGGTTPFGVNPPNTVTTFEKGSRYIYAAPGAAAGPQLSGRTYGHLEYNRVSTGITGGGDAAAIGNLPLVILDDLIITTGNVRLNVAALSIQGNIHMNGGTLVNPTGASTLTLNGSTPQFIRSETAVPVPVQLGSNVSLIIDNARGVTLETPVQVAKAITLTNGLLNTSAAAPLTLLAATSATATASSFVAGPLTRVLSATGTSSLDFPIGSGTAYRPLVLTVEHNDAVAVRYTAEQVEKAPTARTFADDIKQVSTVRSFSVARNSVANNLVSASIQLSYGSDDKVDDVAKARIARSTADNQAWESLGGNASGTPIGTVASNVPFTNFGTFALASTEPGPATLIRPLPVSLLNFNAEPQVRGVLVRWRTATEKDNAGFEVERSMDGRVFQTIAKLRGQGQSTQQHTYSIIDLAPATTSTIYYRLRQLDFNGTATYSGVVSVKTEIQEELFPNPACTQLTFQVPYSEPAAYQILTAAGQTVQQGQAVDGPTTLDVSQLPVGLYFLRVGTQKGHTIRKFMKQVN